MTGAVLVPVAPDDDGDGAWTFASLLASQTDRDLRVLTALPPGIPAIGGNERDVVEYADPALAIRDAVDADAGDVVVMSTRASHSLAALVLGSTADAVLRAVDAPVVLLGPHAVAPPAIERIVVAVRPGSLRSAPAVDAAGELASRAGAVVHLVTVVPTGGSANLEDWARRVREHGAAVQTHVIEGANVARAVLELTTAVGASMVAMTTHGRSPGARLALGSIAMDVVRRASCPVLLLRLR